MERNAIDELVPQALREKIFAAAISDPQFEAAFMESPQAAYRAKFGEDLLPGETVKIERRDDGSVLFSLPRIQQGVLIKRQQSGELSDENLELVLGGQGAQHFATLVGGASCQAVSVHTQQMLNPAIR
jgi:hypothetical protein